MDTRAGLAKPAQAALGVIQVAIGVAMLVGYRRHGVWGAF
jgi:hypothetical protein